MQQAWFAKAALPFGCLQRFTEIENDAQDGMTSVLLNQIIGPTMLKQMILRQTCLQHDPDCKWTHQNPSFKTAVHRFFALSCNRAGPNDIDEDDCKNAFVEFYMTCQVPWISDHDYTQLKEAGKHLIPIFMAWGIGDFCIKCGQYVHDLFDFKSHEPDCTAFKASIAYLKKDETSDDCRFCDQKIVAKSDFEKHISDSHKFAIDLYDGRLNFHKHKLFDKETFKLSSAKAEQWIKTVF